MKNWRLAANFRDSILTTAPHSRRYTFVTVAYDAEAGLLQLQARSMRLYCPADLIEEIILIDNGLPSSKRWLADLLRQYGDLAPLVRIIPAAKLADVPVGTHGWFKQQVLKVAVASTVRSDRYVVLDAKNHLIRKLHRDFLETPTGLPRINGYSYTAHPMREFLERTLTYFNIDPESHIAWFIRTHTPFTFISTEALDLVRYMEDREGRSFVPVFLEKSLSEFFLYSAFLMSKGILDTSYEFTQPHSTEIWGEKANQKGCTEAVGKAEADGATFLAVHRRATEKIDEPGRKVVAEYWHARGLFPSVSDGIRFLRNPNRAHQATDGRVFSWPLSVVVNRFACSPKYSPGSSA